MIVVLFSFIDTRQVDITVKNAGVPKLNRTELVTACEDFSNIIVTHKYFTVYKGTLSSGVEVGVVSTTISSLIDWSDYSEQAYRKKVICFISN